jgi:hypothetical protein
MMFIKMSRTESTLFPQRWINQCFDSFNGRYHQMNFFVLRGGSCGVDVSLWLKPVSYSSALRALGLVEG